jgi:EpsI family protein
VAHPPEICLQGDGATIIQKSSVQITPDIKATQLILEKKDIKEAVVYWYKTGDVYTNDYVKQQLKSSLNRFFKKPASVILIRLVVVFNDNEESQAFERIRAFSCLIVPLLEKY